MKNSSFIKEFCQVQWPIPIFPATEAGFQFQSQPGQLSEILKRKNEKGLQK